MREAPSHASTPPQSASTSQNLMQSRGVPPTPPTSSGGAPQISLTRSRSPSADSLGSTSNERYFDAEEEDVQTKRRSLLRSPGTASSPDLATLVRKAKQRSAAGHHDQHTKRSREHTGGTGTSDGRTPVLTQNGFSPDSQHLQQQSNAPRTRPRSSTTVNRSEGLSMAHKGKLSKSKAPDASPSHIPSHHSPISSDWINSNSRNRSDTVMSKGKSSVRSKTSAFLGKIIGQGSVRDKTRDFFGSPMTPISTSYSSSSFYQSDDAPPVPPIPQEHRPPSASPIADLFISPPATPDLGKPLPRSPRSPNMPVPPNHDPNDSSAISVDEHAISNLRSSSPERTIKGKAPASTKRRSMSVSEADLKKVILGGATERIRSSLNKEWDSGSDYSASGVIKDFKGELSSQLDGISASSLDLKDPSTPKRSTFESDPTSTLADARGRLHERTQRPELWMLSSSPAPTSSPSLTIDTNVNVEDPIVPPQTIRKNSVKFGPRPQRSGSITAQSAVSSPPSTMRDTSRLSVQHRSIASSSEPSLIPARDDENILGRDPKRTVRLVPSSTSVGWPEAASPALSTSMSSQTDLTEDTGNGRVASSAASREEPLDADAKAKELAVKCWREDDDFLPKEKIAEWLGGHKLVNKLALRYYMDYFDFSGLRLDVAFRRLCAKLYLKAETQQVDRILEEFSRRYWETNPTTVYGSASVVHAVSYSLLLLNTDLHVAELASRMSRNQFVRNTLAAIQMQIRPNGSVRASTPELTHDDGSSIRGIGSDGSEAGASALRSRGGRSASVTSWNSVSRDFMSTPATTPNSGSSQTQLNGSSTSVHDPRAKMPGTPPVTYGRNFDVDMENLLKEMYTAIKNQQILQPLNAVERASVSSGPGVHLYRNGSRRQNDRVANLKRGSVRGIQSLFSAHAGSSPYGNSGSLDGRISPVPSFANSAHEVGLTALASASSHFLPPTLGFASNLSHTIIREAQEDDVRSTRSDRTDSSSVSITDEELALLGAPWAKEGMLCRKQYYECAGKRAKSKNWLDVFVVIQKGELNMFIFGEGGGGGTSVVGGGNWLANAQPVGTVSLSHSLAHALPPPGYSRQRPHCFVLTLASGGVYFFQAGTEELVNEWVSTCNYWAARLSKEPLAGGVSNMEYGWNRAIDLDDDRPSVSGDEPTPRDTDTFSTRSTRSWHGMKDSFSLRSHTSPYAERVVIHDWKPPMPSTVPSTHDEETQLDALQKHAASLKADLNKHNLLRTPMQQLYAPRTTNANKAMANWERKSQYLLTEIVKYDSYVESLKAAMSLRLKKRGEKALEKALVAVSPEDESNGAGGKRWKGYPEEETIPESDEPPPTPGAGPSLSVQQQQERKSGSRSSSKHRRESAET
ncbi:uncharacterized protein FOMMEDRAFT_133996 [Fomitiporia mediterranea MF3/22]|uniref:uncharacterized protein n=1 Tax=Fomitiporia mediterranea (strain MF3/22) TaxID=694068 RepID=UPI00044097E1|nr:uncharacterized protein FOMMEDRAFT_133996 [Fomitiporia mediterranea MF3/22]EJD02779.1 hypothetical protein FOMMEDRAFT_133996 [Fomitiporia mediterranea MF3/22]